MISGDASPDAAILNNCHGCDVLIHEVYVDSTARLRSQAWQDYDRSFHTSTVELAEVAR